MYLGLYLIFLIVGPLAEFTILSRDLFILVFSVNIRFVCAGGWILARVCGILFIRLRFSDTQRD